MRTILRFRALLLAALLLRLLVFLFLGPNGSDNHYEVIERLLADGRFPMAHVLAQAFHPPAYYVLSLPWAMAGGARFVEVFSLLLCIANTWLLLALIEKEIASERGRMHALALTAFLPHLLLYSIVVSNDSLANLVGTLALLAAFRFQRDPKLSNAALAGAIAAFGLLTKGTLIAHAAVLFAVVAVIAWQRLRRREAALCVMLFLALTIGLGSYKYIENEVRYGRLLVHGMDFDQPWVHEQQPTIVGVRSWIDVDVTKLLREPYAEKRYGAGWTNVQSVPLLLYATLWHPYVPVSNFRGTWQMAPVVARATYLLAIPATLLIALGWLIAIRTRRMLLPLAFLALNAAIVIAAGVRYDAWSCFQSRLMFPSFAAIAFGYAWGIEHAQRKWPALTPIIDAMCVSLYAAFLTYFAIEFGFVIHSTLS